MNQPNQQAALTTEDKIHRVVMAGMKLMYDPKTFPMLLAGIKNNTPMPQKLAMEVAGIMHLLDQKSGAGLTPDVVAPAAVLLVFELAGFIKQSGAGNPTKDDIQAALPILQKVVGEVFAKMGKAVTGGQPPAAPLQSTPQPPPQTGGLINAQQPGV